MVNTHQNDQNNGHHHVSSSSSSFSHQYEENIKNISSLHSIKPTSNLLSLLLTSSNLNLGNLSLGLFILTISVFIATFFLLLFHFYLISSAKVRVFCLSVFLSFRFCVSI